jgi:divalent metal cation (Fe/Co/Zn/Cd) transporter
VLVDTAPYDPAQLAEYVLKVPAVEQVARVRSRGSTDAPHIDVDVQVAPAMTADQTEAIADAIRAKLNDQLNGVGEVEVHFVPDNDRESDYALLARAHADALALTTHEVHVSEQADGKVLEMHVEVPSHLTLDAAHQQVSLLETEIRATAPEIAEVVTHIEPAALHDPPVAARVDQLEAQARDLLNAQYPGLDWHHLRVYPGQSGFAVSMHVTLPLQMTIEAAHRLAEDAELFLRGQMPMIDRVTIHTEPTGHETTR